MRFRLWSLESDSGRRLGCLTKSSFGVWGSGVKAGVPACMGPFMEPKPGVFH